jgi:hypothetical protein
MFMKHTFPREFLMRCFLGVKDPAPNGAITSVPVASVSSNSPPRSYINMKDEEAFINKLVVLIDKEAERILNEQFDCPTEKDLRVIKYAMYSAVMITSRELKRDLP